MRALQRLIWQRRLEAGEKLLWHGAEARAFGRSDLPIWPFIAATALLGYFVSKDFDYIEPWRIYGGIGHKEQDNLCPVAVKQVPRPEIGVVLGGVEHH